ncbi:MAG: SLBB domain-containing protein [Gemmatimonadaceae bacterium]
MPTPQKPARAQAPGLPVDQLRQLLQSSGMTPDEIRERLREQGYPEGLLDQYLPGGPRDSTITPGDDVFAAIRGLGLKDTTALDSLQSPIRARRKAMALADSAFLDTLQRALRNDTTANAVRALLRSREMQREQADSGFKVFGLDLFERETSQFDPPTGVGADPNYRLGTGDRLALFITGDVERSYSLTVNGEGFVVIPDVGAVNVAGLTLAQLEDALFARFSRVYSGVRRGPDAPTRFFVDVAQTGAGQVYVHGDVERPGSYRVSRAATVMTALYLAGGPTGAGSMRGIRVVRGGHVVSVVDVYDYALAGSSAQDVRLESGDIIFVPPRGPQVRVAGAVLRPATYELKSNETLGDLIQSAGGLSELADGRRIQIDRIVPPNDRTSDAKDRKLIDVPDELVGGTLLYPGDVIRVPRIPRRFANRVTVKGDVWSPGPVGFVAGMRLFEALGRAGRVKPDAFLGEVLLTRLHADSTREMLRTALVDTSGRPVNDVVLADGDEVTVFSTTEMRPKRYITVGGAVRKPGVRIPFQEGMTIRDAVLLAGGLQEGALLTDAEVARLPENRDAGVTAVTTSVRLDSTYLAERVSAIRSDDPTGEVIPAGHAAPLTLRPYDAITIKWQPDWALQQTVVLRGEVKYPGDYALAHKTERLSELLVRAGGLTSAAYHPDGIVFVRQRDSVGRVGISLSAVLRDPRVSDNIQLVDGDSILVPRFTPVVSIRGAVNSAAGVAYVAGADIDYYVGAAGGASSRGDRGRVFVTQPNGKVETSRRRWLFLTSRPHPLPGSTVVVPERDPSEHHDWAAVAATSTSIFGTLVAITALMKR